MEPDKTAALQKDPLVSVIVVTYNSAKYVLETLESARFQTYQNLELIISDDCSTDRTLEICHNWISENKSRFVKTQLITMNENTGIPANCNRGIKEANGEWLKLIAGDDVLLNTAVSDYIEFIKKDQKIQLVYSFSNRYNGTFSEGDLITQFPTRFPERFGGVSVAAKQQFKILLKANKVNAPTVFVKKEIITAVGGYDERFRLREDHPMWIKLTKAGFKFYFLPKVTVNHRFHNDATDSSVSEELFKKGYFDRQLFLDIYIYPNLTKTERMNLRYQFFIRKRLNNIGLNKNKQWAINIDLVLTKYLNPFSYFSFLQQAYIKKS